MASGNVNAQQLQMFVPARELMGDGYLKANVDPERWPEGNQQVWESEHLPGERERTRTHPKRLRTRDEVRNSMYNDDYKGPIEVGQPTILHHGIDSWLEPQFEQDVIDRMHETGQADKPIVRDGSHRMVEAFDRDPSTEVPVIHTDAENTGPRLGTQQDLNRSAWHTEAIEDRRAGRL